MSIKYPVLVLSLSALLLTGCTSGPQYTPEQLAQGVRIKGFHANINLSQKNSRAQRVAHVFGNMMNDVDPEKRLRTATEDKAMNSFISGVVNDGLAVGLGAAVLSATMSSITYNRSHYDEWNAILDPSKYSTIYDAQADALDRATTLTIKGLEKQGWKVIPMKHQFYNQDGSLGKWYDNVIAVVNEQKGCAKPKDKDDVDTCHIVLRTLYYNAASREQPPLWLSDLKEAFIIRSLGVLPDGKTTDGKAFTLSREDREAIAREANNHFYFVGAFDSQHAGFVGEDGQVAYCHLPSAELAKARERDKMSFFEQVGDNAKKNIEKHGWKSVIGIKPLFGE